MGSSQPICGASAISAAPRAPSGGADRGQIIGPVSIRERPAEAEDRAIPGHWEGDLIAGGANTYLATLVERHSRFVMLVPVAGKDTRTVTGALSEHVCRLPQQLRASLTWDRGTEMADHAQFAVATDVKVYRRQAQRQAAGDPRLQDAGRYPGGGVALRS